MIATPAGPGHPGECRVTGSSGDVAQAGAVLDVRDRLLPRGQRPVGEQQVVALRRAGARGVRPQGQAEPEPFPHAQLVLRDLLLPPGTPRCSGGIGPDACAILRGIAGPRRLVVRRGPRGPALAVTPVAA